MPLHLKKKTGALVFFFALFIIVSVSFRINTALGDEFRLTPAIGFQQEYNDNVFFSEVDKTNDYISTVSPGLRIVNRTEKVDFDISGRSDILHYDKNNDLDDTEYFSSGKLGYRFSPNIEAHLKSGYSMDSRPDRDIETSGTILSNIDRKKVTGDFNVNYIITEKTSCAFSYAYDQEDYKDEDVLQNNISDLISSTDRRIPHRS